MYAPGQFQVGTRGKDTSIKEQGAQMWAVKG